jgi:hypothetical protein
MSYEMIMQYHTLKNKKLEDVKKYLLDSYDSIEFIIESENDIIKTSKLHTKNYEAKIIVDSNDKVILCYVKIIKKIQRNDKCIIA